MVEEAHDLGPSAFHSVEYTQSDRITNNETSQCASPTKCRAMHVLVGFLGLLQDLEYILTDASGVGGTFYKEPPPPRRRTM